MSVTLAHTAHCWLFCYYNTSKVKTGRCMNVCLVVIVTGRPEVPALKISSSNRNNKFDMISGLVWSSA